MSYYRLLSYRPKLFLHRNLSYIKNRVIIDEEEILRENEKRKLRIRNVDEIGDKLMNLKKLTVSNKNAIKQKNKLK